MALSHVSEKAISPTMMISTCPFLKLKSVLDVYLVLPPHFSAITETFQVSYPFDLTYELGGFRLVFCELSRFFASSLGISL